MGSPRLPELTIALSGSKIRGTQAAPGDVQSDEYVPRGTLSLLICTHIYVRYMAVGGGVRSTYSAKGTGGLQQLVGGGANPVALGEIHPADCPG